ncbi:MAG: fibronectin type III domain-containing protein [bacterium]
MISNAQKFQTSLAAALLVAPLLAIFSYAPAAQAFSGNGSGTVGSPYQIETCAQFQDISSDLAANYVLVKDIDCTGVTFTPLGTSGTKFTGTFDGNDFSITALTISASGQIAPFAYVGAATIKNVHFVGGAMTSTTSNAGGVIAYALGATVTNISSTATIVASSGWGSGLVTTADTVTMSNSFYNGSVTAGAYASGLVGVTYNTTTIADSYSKGSMNDNIYPGGLVGNLGGGSSIVRSYSTATINAVGVYVGGLVGTFSGSASITDTFYAGLMNTAGSTNHGAISGIRSGSTTMTNVFFDSDACTTCSQGASGTGSDTGATSITGDPTYFLNNSTNAPLDTYNFTTVWQTVTADYPTLRTAGAPTAPSAPQAFSAAKTGDSVVLTWAAPSTVGGGSRTDYEVQYKLSTDSGWTTKAHTADPSLTSITLSGLTIGGVYSFRVRALNSTVFGSLSTLTDEATIVGGVATGLPSGLSVKDATSGVDLTTSGSTGLVTVQVVDTASGLVVGTVSVDLSTNRSFAGITAATSLATGKTVISGFGALAGVSGTHTLFVPKLSGQTQVRICPSATIISDVTVDCTGGTTYAAGDTNVTVVTLASQAYWKIDGLTGTGGIGISPAVATPAPSLAKTGDSPLPGMVLALILLIGSGLGLFSRHPHVSSKH